jgi:hypothetical protein
MSTFVEKLPCKLTTAEKEARGHGIVECMREKVRLAAEKQIVTSALKTREKENDKLATELAQQYDSGLEWREVRCERRQDFERNLVCTYRLDTGEMLRSRAMEAPERQAQIEFPDNDNGGPGDESEAGDDEELDDDAEDDDGDEGTAASAH